MRLVSLTGNLTAGVRAALSGGVTAAAGHPRPGRQLTASTHMLAAPSAPPPMLGSPWVTSELNTVFADILGADATLPLTREVAMRVPAVARARHTICPTLARIPLVVSGSSPETARFLDQPDPAMSRFLLVTWTLDDMLFHGVSWWQVTARYAGSSRPQSVRRVLPGGVQPAGQGRWTVYGQPADPADLWRIDGPHEGILNFGSVTLRQAADIESAAARNARNPLPAVDLHQETGPTLPEAERTALVKAWAAARRGDDGGVAYTSPGIVARVLGAVPEHLLISGRNAAAVDVARHAGIPADSIDATPEKNAMTYATVETRMRALVDFGLAAYGSALTARLSMSDVTPAGTVVGLDYTAVTAVTDDDPTTPAPAGSTSTAPTGRGGPDERNTP